VLRLAFALFGKPYTEHCRITRTEGDYRSIAASLAFPWPGHPFLEKAFAQVAIIQAVFYLSYGVNEFLVTDTLFSRKASEPLRFEYPHLAP
jgi:hypothetical protein